MQKKRLRFVVSEYQFRIRQNAARNFDQFLIQLKIPTGKMVHAFSTCGQSISELQQTLDSIGRTNLGVSIQLFHGAMYEKKDKMTWNPTCFVIAQNENQLENINYRKFERILSVKPVARHNSGTNKVSFSSSAVSPGFNCLPRMSFNLGRVNRSGWPRSRMLSL